MVVQIQSVLTEIFTSVILGLIALGGSYAVYYIKKASDRLKAEIEQIENEDTERLLNTALKRLSEVTVLTVNKLEQSTAKMVREAIADGKLDKDELESLSVIAYSEIRNVLEPEYMTMLEDWLGDAETYILNLIEDKLVEIKNRDQVLSIAEPI